MGSDTAGYWVSAGRVAYYRSVRIPGADGATFQALNETWAKDARRVYSVGRVVAGADADSFRVLNRLYAKDKYRCYYLCGTLPKADPSTFQVLDDGECVKEYRNGLGDRVYTDRSAAGYAADCDQVFHYVLTVGKPCALAQAHRDTFEVLGYGFGRDRHNVYYEKSRLKGSDAPSFEVVPPSWGKDGSGVFYGQSRLPGADPKCFGVLSSHDFLSTDRTRYYDRMREIPREHAYPHGSAVPGYPLSWVETAAQVAEYLRRGATPQDRFALCAACHKGNVEVIQLLLDAGCNPRVIDIGQNSCLTELYGVNSLQIAKLLVRAGADVNHMQTYSPATHGKQINAGAIHHPLEHALFLKQFDLADYLISAGANLHAKTGEGHRLIDYFRKLENAAAVAYLTDRGA